jgi:hypothetical protein
VDFHLLLFAGFDRRTEIQGFRTKGIALKTQRISCAEIGCVKSGAKASSKGDMGRKIAL